MSASTPPAPPPGPPPPEVYEATCATDGSDAVDRGRLLTRAEAEARRRAGLNIVVCGPDEGANWQLARAIEAAASRTGQPPKPHGAHGGPLSLPHWQQRTPPPVGHSFYETLYRKARVTP